jgi:hypothetical protein
MGRRERKEGKIMERKGIKIDIKNEMQRESATEYEQNRQQGCRTDEYK